MDPEETTTSSLTFVAVPADVAALLAEEETYLVGLTDDASLWRLAAPAHNEVTLSSVEDLANDLRGEGAGPPEEIVVEQLALARDVARRAPLTTEEDQQLLRSLVPFLGREKYLLLRDRPTLPGADPDDRQMAMVTNVAPEDLAGVLEDLAHVVRSEGIANRTVLADAAD